MPFVDWKLLGDAQGHACREDRHFGDGVGMTTKRRHQCVTGFVDGHRLLLLRKKDVRPFPATEQHAITGLVEVARR